MGEKKHVPLSSQTGREWCLPETVCQLRCSSLPCWRTLSSCPGTHGGAQRFSLRSPLSARTTSRESWTHHAHSLVHVTVAEDDERRLSPKLQRDLLHVADSTASGGGNTHIQRLWTAMLRFVSTELGSGRVSPLHDVLSDLSGAREAQFTDVRVVGQPLTHQSS